MDIHTQAENTSAMKAKHLICSVAGHRWHRFRREGVGMRECTRCGHLVRSDADPPRTFLPG